MHDQHSPHHVITFTRYSKHFSAVTATAAALATGTELMIECCGCNCARFDCSFLLESSVPVFSLCLDAEIVVSPLSALHLLLCHVLPSFCIAAAFACQCVSNHRRAVAVSCVPCGFVGQLFLLRYQLSVTLLVI